MTNRRTIGILVWGLVVLGSARQALAWDSFGHMLVAANAYDSARRERKE